MSCRAAATPDFGTFITPPFVEEYNYHIVWAKARPDIRRFVAAKAPRWLSETVLIPVLGARYKITLKLGTNLLKPTTGA